MTTQSGYDEGKEETHQEAQWAGEGEISVVEGGEDGWAPPVDQGREDHNLITYRAQLSTASLSYKNFNVGRDEAFVFSLGAIEPRNQRLLRKNLMRPMQSNRPKISERLNLATVEKQPHRACRRLRKLLESTLQTPKSGPQRRRAEGCTGQGALSLEEQPDWEFRSIDARS